MENVDYMILDESSDDLILNVDVDKISDRFDDENFMYHFVLSLRALYNKTIEDKSPGMIICARLLTDDLITRSNIMRCISIATALKKEFGRTNIVKKSVIYHNSNSISLFITGLKPFIYAETFEKISFEKIAV